MFEIDSRNTKQILRFKELQVKFYISAAMNSLGSFDKQNN